MDNERRSQEMQQWRIFPRAGFPPPSGEHYQSRDGAKQELRVVIQRVTEARVQVDDQTVGEISTGLVVLVAFATEDTEEQSSWMAEKLWSLRIFADEDGRMNRSTREVGGGLLVVSQFTLYGDAQRGRRPSFTQAASPEQAERLYGRFVSLCRQGGPVAEGRFGAMMEVTLVNDGPVTLVIDR